MPEKNDSYWYVDGENIKPLCRNCHAKKDVGWFWSKEKGYGDWDINCSECGQIINKVDGPEHHDKD